MAMRYCLEVRGNFACFTRPELKVERVSYDVITPSAARAIFEAIFWKPAIRWNVSCIEVLNPIHWASVRRNELGRTTPMLMAKQLKGGRVESPAFAIEDERQQRASLLLRDVRYRIYANLEFDASRDPTAHYSKYTSMFERRVEKGQTFHQPYLGCREFACSFRWLSSLDGEPAPIAETRDLGWMLYDMDYSNTASPQPRFFHAALQDGRMLVPARDSEAIRG